MLRTLISSKTKRSILKKFWAGTDDKYYVRQLSAALNISVGTVYRELIKFEKSGILNSEYVGNLRFFSVNKKNPLFKELKQMIFKTEGVKGRLEEELNSLIGIKTAFIYGSFAKQEERNDSDIDLFLLGKIDEDDLVKKISGLESEFGREINYTIYTPEELSRVKNKNSFLKEVLNGPKELLIGDRNDL